MGTMHYFLNRLKKDIEIDRVEAQYIVTCVDYPNIHAKEIIKKLNSSIERDSSMTLGISELYSAFPILVSNIVTSGNTVKKYFESMDEYGHNSILIKDLKKISGNDRLKGTNIIKDLIKKASDCSVQLGRFENDTSTIWTPLGLHEEQIDTRYIIRRNGYFATHGINEIGQKIVIEYLENENIIEDLKKISDMWTDVLEKEEQK
jgi:hypothetical protein